MFTRDKFTEQMLASRPMVVQPEILSGNTVRLEPMEARHLDSLCSVGLDEELWRWTPYVVSTREEMAQYLNTALKDHEKGVALPFVTISQDTNEVIGSTRFANIECAHRRLEIGWTWLSRQWQRTRANTEAKYLMLIHAFETLGCLRVEFKTDFLNEKSRNALVRIGAKEEGVFRNHMITASGRLRDTIYFSIIASEWLSVKSALEEKLHK